MPFVKIHGTILDSSVWELSSDTRIVWIALLAMADENGVVGASIGGLARRAVVTRERCEEALAIFLGPDGDSRDGTTGERIEKVPGGWLVLNHAEYRDRQTTAQAKTAIRVARHRRKVRADREGVTGNDVTGDLGTSPPEAEADQEGEPEAGSDQPPTPSGPAIRSGVPEDAVQREIRSNHVSINRDGGLEVSYDPTPLLEAGTVLGQSLLPSSGVLHEIDMIRRTVEAETGETVGALTHRLDKLDGLAPAITDKGLTRVLEVVKFRCDQVARREVKPALWRRLFSGDGFYAALEQLETHERNVRQVREAIAADPQGSPEEQAAGLALLESHKLGG